MKRIMILVCMLGVVITFLFCTLHICFAAEPSSTDLGRIEAGIKKIKDSARGIQKEGYEELRKIGIASAPYLIEILKDKTVNREPKTLACDLLGELKAKQAVEVLIYTLKNDSYTIKAAACKALGKIADAKAVNPLLGMLSDGETAVREAAIYALISFKDSRIPSSVVGFLKDNNEYVRIAAATLLNDKLDKKTAPDLRQAIQQDKSQKVRLLAIEALGALKDKDAVAILAEAVVEDKDHFIHEECAVALGKIGDKKAVSALIEALKDDYKDVQLKTASSLKAITGKDFGIDYSAWSNWYNSQKK